MTGLGLDGDEARTVGDHFGVAVEQVRRDHPISHILAALSASHADELIFFGGTATGCYHRRSSETIHPARANRQTASAVDVFISSYGSTVVV